ncbi:putative ribonuclease H-like domain-containing protein [Tanacetum coccineum]|uniref:Ribonuclease H-like domain-containing protein n=1 Tax=Tanacetum coccineum TaxID=301880 RepID=A0ABQ5GWV6_9ASTR
MGLLTMDDGIVNWGEHTEAEETNHALMAISSSNEVTLCSKTCIDSYNTLKTLCDEQMNQLGDQEAQILAYSQAANEIYEKDEKLKRYRRIGMKAVKEKEQLLKIVDSWKDSSKNLWRLIDSGMSFKQCSTSPKWRLSLLTQEDIDVSLYVSWKDLVEITFCSTLLRSESESLSEPNACLSSRVTNVSLNACNGKLGSAVKDLAKSTRPDPKSERPGAHEQVTSINWRILKNFNGGSVTLEVLAKAIISGKEDKEILLKVPRHHNMYSFDMKTPSPAKGFACLIAKATSDESKLWHRRLGHINFKNLNKLVKGNLVRGLPSKVFKNDHTCVACHKGKQHRASCKAKLERLITVPLHTLHMDLFGPTSVKSINHASYCLVITDDCTRFSWVFFLASKDETSGILQTFIRQIENQLSHRVKIIRSDNGTEFKNRDMLEFCGNKGIKQEYSTARTPQQNGVAERMNRTLIEAARTMLADSLLPTTFWAEAVSTACYIFNRVRVTKPQNKTPYELLFGHKPIISYIRPFGCHVTILDTLSVLGKFDGKSDEGFLVGYSLNSKAYRVYNLVTKRVEVNLHVNFLEDKPNVKGVGYRWMFDIDYLTDSMNYIPVSLENQANPHAGTSEVTNNTGTSQTPNSNASEEKDEEVELIVVPSAVKIPEEKDESRTSSTNSKKEETLTEPQKEKKDSSTDTLEDNPKIQAFRRELEEIALKHLGTVPENNSISTPSVNTGSQTVNTGRLDLDDSPMPELEIFHKSETGIFDEASYDEEGLITDFNSLPTEIEVSPTPTLRIHNIHPKSQILGDPKSAVQTRSKVQQKSGARALLNYIQRQQRNNHKDQQITT